MLTFDEIEMCLEALDLLEGERARRTLIQGAISALTSRDKETAERRLKETEDEFIQSAAENRLLAKRITLLKAKLIGMQDEGQFEEAGEDRQSAP